MKKIVTTLAIAAASFTSLPAQAALADNGDGTLACVSGEICLAENSGGGGGLAHFYYGARHGSLTWHNGGSVEDNLSSVWNRDTACDVTVIDYAEWNEGRETDRYRNGVWNSYVNTNSDMNDDNDEHVRC